MEDGDGEGLEGGGGGDGEVDYLLEKKISMGREEDGEGKRTRLLVR